MFIHAVGLSVKTGRAAALLTLTVLMSLLVANARASEPAPTPIGPGITEVLGATGQARVVIALAGPATSAPNGPVELASLNRQVSAVQQAVLAQLGPEEYRSEIVYNSVPALAGVILSSSALDKLAANPNVVRVDLDAAGHGGLNTAVPFLNADERHTLGNRGAGVVVAVLDSGVDRTHPDLSDDIAFERCFADTDVSINGIGGCPNGSDRQSGVGSATDDVGHGTAVSGIITSNGGATGPGIARDAKVEAYKVLYDCGSGGGCFNSFSEIVAALDYIINNRPAVDVINMSLGTYATFSGNCDNSTSWTMAGASAINTLRAKGVIAVASAGNDNLSNAMGAPACLQNVISAGSSGYDDDPSSFTNRSATTDVFAPGEGIVTTRMGGGSSAWSGTSFSSPLVAGCAALLIESGDATTPAAIENRLKTSVVTIHDPVSGRNYPRLDCAATNGPSPSVDQIYLSPAGSGSVGGLAFTGADILRYNRNVNAWTMVYDGSARGTPKNIGAFSLLSDGSLLLVFSANQAIAGLGTATPYDVVRFTPANPDVYPLGPGTYSWFLQGRTLGLTTTGEKIDAVDWIGAWVTLSTTGAAKLPLPGGAVLSAVDEDVFVYELNNTRWRSTLLVDGSLIPGMAAEDLSGVWDDPNSSDLYVTITGAFNLGGVRGNGKSLVKLTYNGGATVFTPSLVQWLAPGAVFGSTLDGLDLGD